MRGFKKGLNEGDSDDKSKIDKPADPAKSDADKPDADR